MPQPYTLVARPVILSENKRNVIPHGRPLSPIGTVRSTRPFFVPQVKDSFAEEKHGDTIFLDSTRTKSSSTTIMDYHTSANEQLMTINNNLSLMLKESFAGIDSICQKVRLCLLEANTLKSSDNLKTHITENSETRTAQNLETHTAETESLETSKPQKLGMYENLENRTVVYQRENYHLLSTCEEEEESKASIDEVPDIPEDLDENVAEIVEEIDEDDDNKENENEDQEEITKSTSGCTGSEIVMTQAYKAPKKKTPSITPFFTILNPTTQSAESVGVNLIKSMTSKIGISRKGTTESFHKTMKEVEKLTDYEQFLTSMVEAINKEIDECYAAFPKIKEVNESDNDGNKKGSGKKGSRPNSRPASSRGKKRQEELCMSEALKRFHEVSKIQRELMEDQFSENDLTCRDSSYRRQAFSINTCRLNFTHPDVYRKRAITDLHKRLEAQVEANDSLIFFQKLMAKSRKHMNSHRPVTSVTNNCGDKPPDSTTLKSPMRYLMPPSKRQQDKKPRSLLDLSKKYQDSLWFKQRKHETKRSRKEPASLMKRRDKRGKKDKKVLPQSYTIESSVSESVKVNKICAKAPFESSVSESVKVNKICAKAPFESSVSERVKVNKICAKAPSQVPICNCKIKITNDQPLSDAQKCKLHWMRTKCSQLRRKKLQYLDILDDITKNDLLPIKAEYPRRDEIKSTGIKDSYLYKLMYGKNNETQNAWEQLFQPSTRCSQENCQTCSKTFIVHKENPDEKINEEINIKNRVEMQPTSDLEKGDIIRKLSKYIFAEEIRVKSPKRVFTVMPVHVFYDNSRTSTDNRRTEIPQKLPLIPMKETKEFVKKAEWNDATTRRIKPMRVVYDPILRKIEKEIRLVNARPEHRPGHPKFGQTNSWSPKNFTQFCSPKSHSADARPYVKIDTLLDKTSSKQRNSAPSKSSPPIAEIFKRSPKPSKEKVSHPLVPPLWNLTLDSNKHQKEAEVKQKIQKTVSEETTARVKNEQQRKIWEHKYGKSVGQKLLNFIEKQPAPYQIPVPKYALPKTVNPIRHQVMLEQLRDLKQKNDNIQTNIQKAIQVIENKMVDILSKPTTSESIEAFDEMEKEITNVLSLMKNSNLLKGATKKEKGDKLNDYGADISDELFQRLDRILESPGVSSSGKSSRNSLKKEEKAKKRKIKLKVSLPLKSTDMNQVCFSSTSATGEEKFTITAISPKRTQHRTPTVTPFIKNAADVKPTATEDVSTISNELRRLENELKFKKNSEYVNQSKAAEPDNIDSEPTREITPLVRSSVQKQRKGIPEQEQVVNIALLRPQLSEGSAGDQLQELKKFLENELKSIDASDEIGVSFSQGDYEVTNVVKGDEKVSDSTEIDTDSPMEDKEETYVTEEEEGDTDSLPKLTHNKETEQEVIDEKEEAETAEPEKPKQVPEINQEDAVVQQKISQLSVTGPYFTPLTSPLNKTRCYIDEDQVPRCPTVEEERQSYSCEENEFVLETSKQTEDDDATQHCEKDECQNNNDEKQHSKDDPKTSSHVEDKEKPSTSTYEEEDRNGESDKDDFYEHVNKIISRVENVYNQLEEFEDEMLQEEQKLQSTSFPISKIPVLQDEPAEMTETEVDTFLTPFTPSAKDLRKPYATSEKTPESRQSSPRMNRSPSLYNVLNFLDNLADFKQKEQVVEVHTPRVCYLSYVVNIAQMFRQAIIQHQTLITNPSPPPVQEEPKKKVGCLKTPGSHSTVNTVSSKSKQKVSFLLQKEEKSTQVTPCPFHSVARILSQQKMSTSTDTSFLMDMNVKKDEQVSAYLDARENKSVDKMSLPDDETTYQSTFEFSDENSSDKNSQMPEQIVQNLQETLDQKQNTTDDPKRKSVVEIFRNNNAEDNLCRNNNADENIGRKNIAEENPTQDIKVFPAQNDIDQVETVSVGIDGEEAKGFSSEEVIEEAFKTASEEASRKSSIKVFYDDYKAGENNIDLKLICGFYNEDSILQAQNSLSKDIAIKKRDSLEKLFKNINENFISTEILKESNLFKPLDNLDKFIDSKLLKEAVEKRQTIRMMRRKSSHSVTLISKRETNTTTQGEVQHTVSAGEKENLLKGFYVFVYLLMFTALNLEYKCV